MLLLEQAVHKNVDVQRVFPTVCNIHSKGEESNFSQSDYERLAVKLFGFVRHHVTTPNLMQFMSTDSILLDEYERKKAHTLK